MKSQKPPLDHSVAAPPTAEHTIAIAATFTAEPVEEVLMFWSRTLEMPFGVSFAPYHQVFQQLLDPSGVLARNKGGLNVVLVRWEDWGNDPGALDRALDDFIAALRTAATATSTPLLIAICPASRSAMAERQDHLDRLEARLRGLMSEPSTVHLLTTADMLTAYPVQEYDDPARAALGHVPYTPVFFAALGTLIVRHWYALQQTRYKVIALDCDETLWKGVCGEVGPHGVRIEAAHEHLQRLMVAQQQAGMLLCLDSKNNDEDVEAVFEQRTDMPLERHHLVASRINWRPKSENLMSLAAELRLGLDSFIFVDDDPVACAEVEANCPEVLTLQLPEPLGVPRYLNHVWAFDRVRRTEEDAQRTALYRSDVERERSRKESLRFDEFFAKLGLEIELREMRTPHLARVAQLTQRTNQFNCTTIRRTEDELARLSAGGQVEGVVVDVRDRFGSYGLVGVVLFRREGPTLEVDTFLLSCRALGRGVEHRMLSFVGELAQARGSERVDLSFRPTRKNLPAFEFLERLGKTDTVSTDGAVAYRLTAADAAAIRFQPGDTPSADPAAAEELRPSAVRARTPPAPSTLIRRIATELSDAEQIRRAVDADKRRARPELPEGYVAPRTQIEIEMAALWSQVLGLDHVGACDDFFALGGHSLLATLLVSRMRDAFEADVSLDTFFERPTVAGLADWIQEHRIQHAAPAELNEMLLALEKLSDAEVEALLAGDADADAGATTSDESTRDEVSS